MHRISIGIIKRFILLYLAGTADPAYLVPFIGVKQDMRIAFGGMIYRI